MAKQKIVSLKSEPTSSGRLTMYFAILECGHKWYDRPYEPLTYIAGAEVECSVCDSLRADEEWLRGLDYSIVHHSRFDPRFGGRYRFYRLDPHSPSNFMIIGGVQATPAIDAILKIKTACGPLSPTERA